MKYIIILALIILAWCPWLTAEEAMRMVEAKVMEMQAQNPELCAMTIHPETISKIPFGYTEQVSYNCAVNDAVFGVTNSTNVVYVTFFKYIWGMPNKTIKSGI